MAVEHTANGHATDGHGPAGHLDLGAHRHLVVSERLRLRRRELGLTQKEVVARLRRLGVCSTNKALSALEHGAGLDVAKLPELAQALDCTLTYLVGLTQDPHRWEPDEDSWHRPAPSRPGGARPEAVPSPSGGRTPSPRTDPGRPHHREDGGLPPPIIGPVDVPVNDPG